MPIPISKDIRDQILARVREGKETVVEIARQHGLAGNTVYGWISRSVNGPGSPLLQAARLKKENRYLKQIIGNLMLDMETGKKIAMIRTAVNKTELAKESGISRSSLYYQPKRPAVDEEVRRQIESVLSDHPAYGHKRIALTLKLNKKRIRRVMKKFGLKPYRRKAGRPKKTDDMGKSPTKYQNLIENLKVDRPYLQDFFSIEIKSYKKLEHCPGERKLDSRLPCLLCKTAIYWF